LPTANAKPSAARAAIPGPCAPEKLVWLEGGIIASAASYVLVTALSHRLPFVTRRGAMRALPIRGTCGAPRESGCC